ncbi:hypothetical protein [Luteimonas fraxinea]|uniref:Terminase small subunit n=1 Tax=Luteimonas fraxinea TaxID=2901869 RepID=A0ABS8UC31_9GAMM|nr:hypothetical protein [Luteimonas fraxinea]MCD9097058.1 hypothetical protein [Luteimonas fraxinea]
MSSAGLTMTVAEYAAHRGCSDSYVRRLRRNGKLVLDGDRIVVTDSDRLVDDITDPVRGGNRAVPAGADAGQRGRAASGEVQDAIHRERLAKARIAELELAQAAKELTRTDGVERAVFTLVRQALNELQGMKWQLRGRLAAATDPAEVDTLLDEHVSAICARMRKAARALNAEPLGAEVVDHTEADVALDADTEAAA